MATNHIQKGAVMPWTNGTGSDVSANDVVEVGTLIGVALGDIDNGAAGQLAIDEVWEVDKQASLAISQGAKVYWDSSAGEADATDTNTYMGRCFEAALAAADTVKVLLNR